MKIPHLRANKETIRKAGLGPASIAYKFFWSDVSAGDIGIGLLCRKSKLHPGYLYCRFKLINRIAIWTYIKDTEPEKYPVLLDLLEAGQPWEFVE